MAWSSGLLIRTAALVALGAGLLLAASCDDGGGSKQVEKLFSPQNNELDVYDLETGEMTVLIPSEQNNVNGQVCMLPDGSGNFLMGEDTNQNTGARQGWGIFSPEGDLLQKILDPETPGEADTPEPYGCAFDGEVYVGVGFGAQSVGPEEAQEAAEAPGGIWAFCVRGEGCTDGME